MKANLMNTLEKFVKSNEFADAIVKSTKAGWGGSGYSVEIFPDGTHRVLWDNAIGNLYRSPGMLVAIPQLSAEECDEVEDDSEEALLAVAMFYAPDLADQVMDRQ